mmetsp:Transcript_37541/g.86747  ORF Transcript_37541/g.86747 Transcript_37541/m.86747 type:complete len:1656 (+) Transcript_37541:523-5490(+)
MVDLQASESSGTSRRMQHCTLKDAQMFPIWLTMLIMILQSDDKIDLSFVFTVPPPGEILEGNPVVVPLEYPEPDDVDDSDNPLYPKGEVDPLFLKALKDYQKRLLSQAKTMDYFTQAINPTILSAVMHKAYATKVGGAISFSGFFSCLQSHCLGMSGTSRAACMLNFISLARQARETPLQWLDRVQRSFNSIAHLKLKPEDIFLLISLKGLGQEYAALVQSTINDPNNTTKPAIDVLLSLRESLNSITLVNGPGISDTRLNQRVNYIGAGTDARMGRGGAHVGRGARGGARSSSSRGRGGGENTLTASRKPSCFQCRVRDLPSEHDPRECPNFVMPRSQSTHNGSNVTQPAHKKSVNIVQVARDPYSAPFKNAFAINTGPFIYNPRVVTIIGAVSVKPEQQLEPLDLSAAEQLKFDSYYHDVVIAADSYDFEPLDPIEPVPSSYADANPFVSNADANPFVFLADAKPVSKTFKLLSLAKLSLLVALLVAIYLLASTYLLSAKPHKVVANVFAIDAPAAKFGLATITIPAEISKIQSMFGKGYDGPIAQMGDNGLCDSGSLLHLGPMDFLPFLTDVVATTTQASAANAGIIKCKYVGTLHLAYRTVDNTLAIATLKDFNVTDDIKVMIFNESDLLSQWNADLINLSRPSKININGLSLDLQQGRYLITAQGIIKLKNMCIELSVFKTMPDVLVAPIAIGSAPPTAAVQTDHADSETCSECSASAAARLLPLDDGSTAMTTDKRILHARLGHASTHTINLTIKATDGLLTTRRLKQICPACVEGKATKLPFGDARHQPGQVFDTVSVDMIGPINSLESFRTDDPEMGYYFILFLEQKSNYGWIYRLENRSQAPDFLIKFLEDIQHYTVSFGCLIRQFRLDGAKEFDSSRWNNILRDNGIGGSEITPARTPELNAHAERYLGTITRDARALLVQAGLPNSYAEHAFTHAVYIRNRLVSLSSHGITPYQHILCRRPDLSHLRAFGSDAWAVDTHDHKFKLDPRSAYGILVGYGDGGHMINAPLGSLTRYTKAAILRLYPSGKLVVSRHVRVDESSVINRIGTRTRTPLVNVATPTGDWLPDGPALESISLDDLDTISVEGGDDDDQPPISTSRSLTRILRSATTTLPKKDPNQHVFSLLALIAESDQPTLKQAMAGDNSANWHAAIQSEYTSIDSTSTWVETSRRPGMRVLKTGLVLSVKRKSDGSIDKYKARCIAKGYQQRWGVDYDETFSSVLRYDSAKLIISLAAARDARLYHLDFKTAYLNAPLEEAIYIDVPFAYKVKTKGDIVLKLRKSLYGLKQSGRNWRELIHNWLTDYGFTQSRQDPCVYSMHHDDGHLSLGIYVDDLLIADFSGNPKICDAFLLAITSTFKTTLSDDIDSFLSMKLTRSAAGIKVTISRAILELLERTGLLNARPVDTPMAENLHLVASADAELLDAADATEYRSIVGALIHISHFRPDIMFAMGTLTHFMSRPGEPHLGAAKRVLRYLAGTIDLGLMFKANVDLDFTAFVDADYANCTDTRKSISGFVTQVGGSTVSARREKQSVVTLSSTEAEYVAVTSVAKEVIALRQLLADIGFPQSSATPVGEDNVSCIALSKNDIVHRRTKHVDIKFHWIRDLVKDGVIKLFFVPGLDNVADIMTKPLGKTLFIRHRHTLLGM